MHRLIEKHAPKEIAGFHGRAKQLQELKRCVESHRKGRSAMLFGPVGCGKTTAVYALAREMNYEVLEVNASDARDKESILQVVGTASKQMSLFNEGKIILIDDVDSLSSKDRGAASAIGSLVADSEWPVVMTATDITEEKIKDLRKKAELIEIKPLAYHTVYAILKDICEAEKIEYDDTALKSLARQAGGDIRAALTDMQVLQTYDGKVKDLSILSPRQQSEAVHGALLRIFKGTKAENVLNAFDSVDMDEKDKAMWVDENIPHEYSGKSLAKAYEVMSRIDVFTGRIMRRQHWRFLAYINEFLTAGIALAKDEKNPKIIEYKRNTKPLKFWLAKMKYEKKRLIAEKVAAFTHVSKKIAFRDIVPYISVIFKNNHGKDIAQDLNLNEEEIEWLTR